VIQLVEAEQGTVLPTECAMRERSDSLAAFESLNSVADPGYKNWTDIRIDRWLVDYMLRSGRFNSAAKHSDTKCISVRVSPPDAIIQSVNDVV
jgi:macrophage erythroblast attacher